MFLYELSADHPALAAFEIESLLRTPVKRTGRFVLAKTAPPRLIARLALTRAVYKVLFAATQKTLLPKVCSYQWQRIYRDSFAVTAPASEREIAAEIHSRIKRPTVNLKSPQTDIHFIDIASKMYAALKIHENKEQFQQRRSHLRPAPSGTSLHPKIARAIINLTGTRTTLTDPFCGAGGILIEACLMNLKATGYDIDSISLRRAEKNLAHYCAGNYALGEKNALDMPKARFVATDMPYGRQSRISAPYEQLYCEFFAVLERKLTRRAVVVLPTRNVRAYFPKTTRLKLVKAFDIYVHKSLTRTVAVIQ